MHHVQNVCTSCKKCNGRAFFHVYYVQTMYMYATVTNQVGYIQCNSKSPVAMGLWSKNHSLSSGYHPQTRMVLDHKSLATGLLLLHTQLLMTSTCTCTCMCTCTCVWYSTCIHVHVFTTESWKNLHVLLVQIWQCFLQREISCSHVCMYMYMYMHMYMYMYMYLQY